MQLLLGTDEAGYGPNLGPLVVVCSAWQVPDRVEPESLYAALEAAVCCGPARAGDRRLAIGDSKQLYKPGGGLAALERGVFACLALLQTRAQGADAPRSPDDVLRSPVDAPRWPRTWSELFTRIDGRLNGDWYTAPWHDEYDQPLPIDADPEEVTQLASSLASCCTERNVRLVGLEAAVLAPAQFNDEVSRCGNKAEVLSLTTLALARRMLESLTDDRCPADRVQVGCDRHGGRARYAALLQHTFPDEPVIVRQETAELGIYELGFAGRRVEFRFLVGGERMLPTALASMTAKYARELAMRPFNAFWQRHVPGLRATAGYPTDAKRFREEIRAAQRKLAIADRDLWRER